MPSGQPELIERLRARPGFWYLATPYSKYRYGLPSAAVEAAIAAGHLVYHGIGVFSPIAHSHAIAEHSGIDPLDHAIWLPADAPMMDAATGLLIVKMDGWQDSYGIGQEIAAFRRMHKPIEYMEWPLV